MEKTKDERKCTCCSLNLIKIQEQGKGIQTDWRLLTLELFKNKQWILMLAENNRDREGLDDFAKSL